MSAGNFSAFPYPPFDSLRSLMAGHSNSARRGSGGFDRESNVLSERSESKGNWLTGRVK
jgi:hypothetical protein